MIAVTTVVLQKSHFRAEFWTLSHLCIANLPFVFALRRLSFLTRDIFRPIPSYGGLSPIKLA
jgi:hypothetical protein